MSVVKIEQSQKYTPSVKELQIRADYQFLLQGEEQGEISAEEFVNRSLILGAQLLDEQGILTNSPSHFLEKLVELTQTQQEFEVDPDKNKTVGNATKKMFRVLEHVLRQDNLFHVSFAKSATGDQLGSNNPATSQWKALNKIFENTESPAKLQALVHLIKLNGVSELQMKKWVTHLFEPNTRIYLKQEPDENTELNFWNRRLIGDIYTPGQEGVIFCQNYRKKLNPLIQKLSQELYGEQSEIAVLLWEAVLFIQTEKSHDSLGVFMVPLLNLLTKGEFEEVLTNLDHLLKVKPALLSQKIRNNLNMFINQNPDISTTSTENIIHPPLETYDEIFVYNATHQRKLDTAPEAIQQVEELFMNKFYLLIEQKEGNNRSIKAIYVREVASVSKRVRETDEYGYIVLVRRQLPVIHYRIYEMEENEIIFRGTGSKYPGELIRLLSNQVPNITAKPVAEISATSVISEIINVNNKEI